MSVGLRNNSSPLAIFDTGMRVILRSLVLTQYQRMSRSTPAEMKRPLSLDDELLRHVMACCDWTELRAVFSVFDVDRDGFITVEEVFKVLESMGFLPSPASIDDIFRQVDLDGTPSRTRVLIATVWWS